MLAVVFQSGDELLGSLSSFVEGEHLGAAALSGIGGFSEAMLAYFDVGTKSYLDIPVDEQVELLVLTGDVTCKGQGHQIHLHAVCGRKDGSTVGGHVQRAVIRPTLELVVTETPSYLERRYDEDSGLALIEI